MRLDEETERRVRQDLLEAISSGASGAAIAPMPGVFLEFYEIAAMRRHEVLGEPMHLASAPLTLAPNDSRMEPVVSWIGKTVRYVTGRLRKHSDARGVPA